MGRVRRAPFGTCTNPACFADEALRETANPAEVWCANCGTTYSHPDAPAVPVDTKPRLRRSEFEALRRCPNWQNDASELGILGTDVHAVIAGLIRTVDPNGDPPSPEIVAASLNGRSAEVRELVEMWLTRWDEQWAVGDPEVMLTREEDLAILTGTLDLLTLWPVYDDAPADPIGENAWITDWKTGWLVGNHEFQARWYGALVAYAYPSVDHVNFEVRYLRRPSTTQRYDWSADELLTWWDDEIVPDIPRVLEARANGGEPHGGASCRYCRNRLTCAESVAPMRDVPADDDGARVMLSDIVRLRAAIDAREEAMRLYLADRAPLVGNGMEIGYRLGSPTERVDTRAAKAAGLVTLSDPTPRFGLRKAGEAS